MPGIKRKRVYLKSRYEAARVIYHLYIVYFIS